MLKVPKFWKYGQRSLRATMLSPVAGIYKAATQRRANKSALWKAPIPVLCIGNLTMGGAGKTPSALSICRFLKEMGKQPVFLSRGYGGTLKGPMKVANQSAQEVGDEPLLLAQEAPVCVSVDRVAGAKYCVEQGADVIIMDDGFQNPHLYKDMSFIVVDGGFGHGNEKVFPAGPLRESLANGLKRAEAVILIGEDQTGVKDRISAIVPDLPILRAAVSPDEAPDRSGQRLLAFAGIARPEKFYESLKMLGADLVETVNFADHYMFTATDLDQLRQRASDLDATLITTSKDLVRLPQNQRGGIDVLKISLAWSDEEMLKALLSKLWT